MSTYFDMDFDDGDIVEASHVKQFAQPVNDLESGQAWYREATNSSGVYQVDFQAITNPGGHAIEALSAGQVIILKASHNSPAAAELKVLLEGASPETHPLYMGDAQVGADSILANQMVIVVYNDTTTPRFDVLGIAGGGAESLSDLDDVNLGSLSSGEVLQYDGSDFVNAALGIADITGLQSELDDKSDIGHTHAASDIASGTLDLARGGTGSDLSATGGSGQVVKQSTSGGPLSVGALSAADMPVGIDATKIGAGSVSDTEFGYLDGVTSAIQGQINSKAASSHNHAASDINSGQLGLARGGTGSDLSATGGSGQVLKQTSLGGAVSVGTLSVGEMPSGIDAAKIGGGSVSNTEFGYLDGVTSAIQTQINSKAASSHNHSASDITSGTLDLARGGTGANMSATGGAGQVLKQISAGGSVSVGALAASEMPSGIDASKIGGGTISNTEFGYLNGVTSAIQTQLNAKLEATVAVSEGGTGLTSLSANRLLGTGSTASVIQAITIGTGLSLSGGVLSNSAPSTLSGSGSPSKVAFWSGASSLTSYSTIDTGSLTDGGAVGGVRQYLYAGGFYSDGGWFRSGTGRTYLSSVRNFGAGQLMYWTNTGSEAGEVVYQFSRGAHKENVKTVELSIEDLMRWRPVEFHWKQRFGGSRDIGLIAEEVEAVYPLATTYDQPWDYVNDETGEYAVDSDGLPRRLEGEPVVAGVKYEKAWIPMLAAIQDFYRRYQLEISELKARIAALEESR